MFKIKWDPDNNGVVLSEYIEESEALNNPRPVYVEELRMLGLDKVFSIPKENVPVCWEMDRKYYYCGNVIAETRKGNIYEDPTVVIRDDFKGITLKEIDTKHIVEVNEKPLSVIENEAMDFIKQKYEEYQKKSKIANAIKLR
jgi:phosphoadenosine phosphosulfate reductase